MNWWGIMSDSDSDLVAQTEEGFISRWSRRKHVARGVNADLDIADTAAEPMAAEAFCDDTAEDFTDASADIAVVEEYLPDDSDMPPLESLDEDSDYTGFMSPNVSDELRNLALRKLFLGGMFSQRDGLDDYDDDFTSFEKLGDVVTAEMRHQMERLKDADNDNAGSEEALADVADENARVSLATDTEAGMRVESETSISAVDQVGKQGDDTIFSQADENEKSGEHQHVDEDK